MNRLKPETDPSQILAAQLSAVCSHLFKLVKTWKKVCKINLFNVFLLIWCLTFRTSQTITVCKVCRCFHSTSQRSDVKKKIKKKILPTFCNDPAHRALADPVTVETLTHWANPHREQSRENRQLPGGTDSWSCLLCWHDSCIMWRHRTRAWSQHVTVRVPTVWLTAEESWANSHFPQHKQLSLFRGQ